MSEDRREFVIGALLDEVELAGTRVTDKSETRPCVKCSRLLWIPAASVSPGWLTVCARCGRYIVEEAEREAMTAAKEKG